MTEDLELLIRSGNPLIAIETTDEDRAISLLRSVATKLNRHVGEWSMTTGLRPIEDTGLPGRAVTTPGKVNTALDHLWDDADSGNSIIIFKDIGAHCSDAMVVRKLRDLASESTDHNMTMVLIDPVPLPDSIKRFTVQHDIGWPTADELEKTVRVTFKRVKGSSEEPITSSITRRDMDQLVQTLRGLSLDEAERVVTSAILNDQALTAADIKHIVEVKRTLLGSTGSLETVAADFAVEDIGGLDRLKTWLKQRRGVFSREAREFGLDSPRGVLMLGVPGCGKSLCAKVVAADWNMPLLRLDPGVLYQKFIGESESQLRRALAQAEATSPAVLWIDEIEKAFASASASSADGGLSKRMFGTLLSWMQDHRHPIFIVATANDISALPPELMRKGRFDEVFFVDLPTELARKEILRIHLTRKRRDPDQFDLHQLAEASEDFSGSEIEQAVISAMFTAFHNKEELQTKHILTELEQTHPLAVTTAEKVAELRQWASQRCVMAD